MDGTGDSFAVGRTRVVQRRLEQSLRARWHPHTGRMYPAFSAPAHWFVAFHTFFYRFMFAWFELSCPVLWALDWNCPVDLSTFWLLTCLTLFRGSFLRGFRPGQWATRTIGMPADSIQSVRQSDHVDRGFLGFCRRSSSGCCRCQSCYGGICQNQGIIFGAVCCRPFNPSTNWVRSGLSCAFSILGWGAIGSIGGSHEECRECFGRRQTRSCSCGSDSVR